MSGITKLFAMLSLIAILGCATGAPYSEIEDTIPELGTDRGRIYLYRKSAFGAALQPKVFLNGEEIGKSVAQGFFFVDRAPGNYEIKTSTEVKRTLSLTLDAGQVRFVRFGVSMGFFVGHVFPELVDNDAGNSEIQKCKYTGKD